MTTTPKKLLALALLATALALAPLALAATGTASDGSTTDFTVGTIGGSGESGDGSTASVSTTDTQGAGGTGSSSGGDTITFGVYQLAVNEPPTATNVQITPQVKLPTDDLEVTYTYNDPDGDAENGTTIEWYVNGVNVQNGTTLNNSHTQQQDYVRVVVTPSDGENTGSSSEATTTVRETPRFWFYPGTPRPTEDVQAMWRTADENTTVQWYINDEPGPTGDYLNQGNYSPGDTLTAEITPTYGNRTLSATNITTEVLLKENSTLGSGTLADPYQISNWEQLDVLDNSAHIKFVSDVAGPQRQFGGTRWVFTNSTDGNGFGVYAVRNVVSTFSGGIGFSNIESNEQIYNFSFVDADITNGNQDIIGQNAGNMTAVSFISPYTSSADYPATIIDNQAGVMDQIAIVEADLNGGFDNFVSTTEAGIFRRVDSDISNFYADGEYRRYILSENLFSSSITNALFVGDSLKDAVFEGGSGFSFSDSYFLNETNTQCSVDYGSVAGCTGLNSTDLQQRSTFSNYDFDNTWRIAEGQDYPQLRHPPKIGTVNAKPLAFSVIRIANTDVPEVEPYTADKEADVYCYGSDDDRQNLTLDYDVQVNGASVASGSQAYTIGSYLTQVHTVSASTLQGGDVLRAECTFTDPDNLSTTYAREWTVENTAPTVSQAQINGGDSSGHWRNTTLTYTGTGADIDNDDLVLTYNEYIDGVNTQNSTYLDTLTVIGPDYNYEREILSFEYEGEWYWYSIARQNGPERGQALTGSDPYPVDYFGADYPLLYGPEYVDIQNFDGTLYALIYGYEFTNYADDDLLLKWNGTDWVNSSRNPLPSTSAYNSQLFQWNDGSMIIGGYNGNYYRWNGDSWENWAQPSGMPGSNGAIHWKNGVGYAVTASEIRTYNAANNSFVRDDYLSQGFVDLSPDGFYRGADIYFLNDTFPAIATIIDDRWAKVEPKPRTAAGAQGTLNTLASPQSTLGDRNIVVQSYDGISLSTNNATSNNFTVTNTAPEAQNLTITPVNATDVEDVNGSYEYFDADSDPENGTTTYWLVNDVIVATNQDNLSSSNYAANDNLTWRVQVDDGIQTTTEETSTIIVQSRDAPTAGVRELRDAEGNKVMNLVNLTVLSDYQWYAANFTHDNISDPNATLSLNIFTGNATNSILNETYNATNETFILSSLYNLPDYQNYSYEFTISDETNLSTTYGGTLSAQNRQPVHLDTGTFRFGQPNSCQKGSTCDLRVDLQEDGCTLTPQNESLVVIGPNNTVVINDTDLLLVSEANGECRFKSDSFTVAEIGQYTYTYSFTDYGGLSTSDSGSFGTTTATQAPPPPAAGAGGAPPAEVVIIKEPINVSFELVPTDATVQISQGSRYLGDFQVVNNGLLSIPVSIEANRAESDEEVVDWINFDGFTRIENLTIAAGQGLNSNSKYINYELDADANTPPGEYLLVLDVQSGDVLKRHLITVQVEESFFADFIEFLTTPLFELGQECTTPGVTSNSTQEEIDAATVCEPMFVVTNGWAGGIVLAIMGGAFFFTRRRDDEDGRGGNR